MGNYPERHLHRSIISPLLTLLFAKRTDCAFVVSTHDVMLPLDNSDARTVLIRNCVYSGSTVTSWTADLMPENSSIDDEVQKEIVGNRRRIIFIEGTERSLDKPLYSILFPQVSIIPKVSCKDVENAVSGIRSASEFAWVTPFGIVDDDRRSADDIERLRSKGVYAIAVYSVESIYYHPALQKMIAEKHAAVTGEDATQLVEAAKIAALSALSTEGERLCARAVEKAVREAVFANLPSQETIRTKAPISLSVDVEAYLEGEKTRYDGLVANSDLATLITSYPIRETRAISEIIGKLGFKNRFQYENAIRKLLMESPEALDFAKSLFGSLPADVAAAP